MSSFRSKALSLAFVAFLSIDIIGHADSQTFLSGVSSVFGRIGAVVAQAGDYAFNQISGSLACTQTPAYTGDTTKASGSCVTATTKTGGVAFAPSATTDTTNASNISSGTLGAARLPNPTSTTLGGIESLASVSHNFLDSISTSGVPHASQPAFTDVSGSVASTQMPALTGDVTSSSGTVATTLASAGAGAGSCVLCSITVDAKGRTTAYSTNSLSSQTGTTYTIASTDCGTIVQFTNGSAITVTLPNSLSVGCTVGILQIGAGQITFSAAGGAAFHNRSSFTKTAGQYAGVSLSVYSNAGGTSAIYALVGDGA